MEVREIKSCVLILAGREGTRIMPWDTMQLNGLSEESEKRGHRVWERRRKKDMGARQFVMLANCGILHMINKSV